MKEYVAEGQDTLKNFTDNRCAPASFCFRALLKAREIRVNGQKVSADVPLKAGDTVRYYLTPAQERKRGFTVVYEDENVLVADKDDGVNSEAVFSAVSEAGERFFIHRLDRNTAGLMIFAKNRAAERELLAAFRERRAEKTYLTRVVGRMKEKHAVAEAYLEKDEAAARVFVSAKPCGEKIVTEYEVLSEANGASVLKVTLHTGKTHQIRAHLAYIGNPVLGDEKYGNRALNRKYGATRQRLLAKELSFSMQGKFSYLNGITFLSPKNL